MSILLRSDLPGIPVRRGKVRDVYDLGDRLLLVATDRISAFDWVMPNGIPDKGRVLTQLSAWWFKLLGGDHHLLSLDPAAAGLPIGEESGSIDHMLGKAAEFYEEEVDDMVKGLSSLMEPIIIVFMGGVVLFIVLAILLPIFELNRIVK